MVKSNSVFLFLNMGVCPLLELDFFSKTICFQLQGQGVIFICKSCVFVYKITKSFVIISMGMIISCNFLIEDLFGYRCNKMCVFFI